MAHKDQLDFFAAMLQCPFLSRRKMRVLEIGSLDINGTIRDLCRDLSISEYIGLDLGDGPGVDVVASGHEFLLNSKEEFDLILSAECLEHNPFWRETIENSIRLLRPKGVMIFSWATTGRAEHGTHKNSPESAPFIVQDHNNYYRNISYSDLRKIKARKNLSYEAVMHNFSHKDLYWVAYKGSSDEIAQIAKVIRKYSQSLSLINREWNFDFETRLAKRQRNRLDGFVKTHLGGSIKGRKTKWLSWMLQKLKHWIKLKKLRPKLIVEVSRIRREKQINQFEVIEIQRKTK